jgi:hypothetical protein
MSDEVPPDSGRSEQHSDSRAEVVPFRRSGAANSNGRKRPTPPASPLSTSDLPVIRMSPRLHEDVDASVSALGRDLELYQRDARLVRVVRVAEAEAEAEHMSPGTPQIRPLPLATLHERLTRYARFQKFDSRAEEWRDALPSKPIVAAVEARAEWPTIRPLLGVIETPSMRPDGSIIDSPGYDAATGYVYAPGRAYPSVPQKPTQADARAALAQLREPWADFPMGADAEHYVPISALMTLIARPAIRGACPAFVADASVQGSGKSFATRAVGILAHGREPAVMRWPTDPNELEKVLGGYAVRGASIVLFDNVGNEDAFGGAPLDKVLTCADRVELRVLGKTEVPALAWRAVILASGNNLAIGRDTTRRVLVCRIVPPMERPEERTDFAITNLIDWCHTNHARLAVAALTVLRAYVVAGRPAQNLAGWGSYEQWRDLIANAIVWAGGADVMACRPTIAGDDDSETAALRAVVLHWPRLAPNGITATRAVAALYSPERMRGQLPPDGFDDLREALEVIAPPAKPGQPPAAMKVGHALKRFKQRVIGTMCITSTQDRNGVAAWKVVER